MLMLESRGDCSCTTTEIPPTAISPSLFWWLLRSTPQGDWANADVHKVLMMLLYPLRLLVLAFRIDCASDEKPTSVIMRGDRHTLA